MNDRFRFRAWVVGCYFSENDERKEVLVKLDNVTVYNDGVIGIDYHSLLESVCSFLTNEGERDSLIEYFEDKNFTTGDDWYYLEAKFIEQCTGLKDNNGRLIYEDDIVKVTGDVITIPVQLEGKLAKVVWDINGFYLDFPSEKETCFSEFWDYEVIGNIHENSDLLKEKSEKPILQEAQNGDN